ncbi:DUF58 domain-containing protein [Arvimicrobium flavum]|uniref:DUF58 domain-containing protein n=1 Tax=Arvimicrobium flavum TaxID=3393320 RepID=UPI00237ADEC4|nr:DUF58 domain-containing protein [Mesorhizobium shangrilense]
MALSQSALGRSTGVARPRRTEDGEAGAYVCVADLVALEAAVRAPGLWARQPGHQLLAGRHASRVRGRGLSFEELREYVAGDDIRSMDWRVTARAGKPFVRVFTEEKDRPALIVIDQRMNMFFGSKRSMKSVAAAEAAALSAWRVLSVGDRVGGIVFNDNEVVQVRPHRSRAAVIDFLTEVVRQNRELHAEAPDLRGRAQLNVALRAAASQAEHDHLVIVISDFDGHDAETRDMLLRLTRSNDVLAVLVYDPFLLQLPESGAMVVSGGALQAELPFGHGDMRARIIEFARERGKELLRWQQELGLPMMPVSAAEETAPQMRRMMAELSWRTRRR